MRPWLAALLLIFAFAGSAGRADTSSTVDRILIEKSAHRMTLFSHGSAVRVYEVALGRGGLAAKQHEGDGKTPEGDYKVAARKVDSAFHRALRISYPGPEDVARAKAIGVDPGGDIMIHGMRNGFGWLAPFNTWFDWTNGCIAVTDSEMDEIWAQVPVGTPVEIRH